MNYDVLIRGGLIVDGSGKPGYLGDVAVRDGKIAYAGPSGKIDGQDNARAKPSSLVADFSKIPETVEAALRGEQIQPLLLR